jgi:hypothetical protein
MRLKQGLCKQVMCCWLPSNKQNKTKHQTQIWVYILLPWHSTLTSWTVPLTHEHMLTWAAVMLLDAVLPTEPLCGYESALPLVWPLKLDLSCLIPYQPLLLWLLGSESHNNTLSHCTVIWYSWQHWFSPYLCGCLCNCTINLTAVFTIFSQTQDENPVLIRNLKNMRLQSHTNLDTFCIRIFLKI